MKLRILILTLMTACGGATTGERVVLHTRIQADALGFDTSTGWHVELETAALATGALYYFDGEPAFVDRRPWWRPLWDALQPISPAYAHPGHYQAGNALGQMLQPSAVELGLASVALPDGDGVTGDFRSATFSLAAPTAGPALATLEGHSVLLVGQATKDGRNVHFRATVDLPEIAKTAKDGQVSGCVLHEAKVAGDGTITVTVHPRIWFNLVDLSELPDGSADAPSPLPPDSTPRIALALGIAQLSAYELAYQQNRG